MGGATYSIPICQQLPLLIFPLPPKTFLPTGGMITEFLLGTLCQLQVQRQHGPATSPCLQEAAVLSGDCSTKLKDTFAPWKKS